MRFVKTAIIVSALLSMPVAAASIVWQSPTTVSDPADVVTAGTLHAAMAAYGATSVNGVNFTGYNAQPALLQAANLLRLDDYGSPNLGDLGYNTLLRGTAYVGGYALSDAITIAGLTQGTDYLVQIWQPFWDANWATSYVAGNASAAVYSSGIAQSGAPAQARPQFVVGNFTADAATQSISLAGSTGIVMFGAIQVRELDMSSTIPEPASWAMLIAGFGLTGAAMRRRRFARA
jgi:hypothetical protein